MAEASVRPAVLTDAEEIARIQRDTWRTAYRDLLPEDVLAGLDNTAAMRELVEEATATVVVATEGEWTVGFCVAGPAPDSEVAEADGSLPDDAATTGLVATLLVEPRWGRRGHGGRLLAAAAEALRNMGATRGVSWVPEADRASLNFYHSVGWQTDGVVRTLDAGGRPLREARVTGPLDLKLINS
ncbi:GNAT family N-acetyltransferase [Kutzneria kofuensis]|uniref:GNAT superfamily N-acetyltransferase n=1 Tax=Kutzneria kofuensis TaxID=103725 RepID=A0A7W9KKI7_9PSEU|nr:GNAT family N-acetyltransferase [Kutzneria kofuensis]MBB5894241.1 GNAT superfamily N-acetyltransferase [Kutzneria kofuensis]